MVAGIDLPSWWGSGHKVEQALCHAYPRGGIPNCGNPAIPPPTTTPTTTTATPTITTTPATATTPQPPPVGPGPLRVGPTGRYLVDQNGVPFLISGESPQALIGDLTESDAALFFANRRAHGFNTVWINVLCNDYTGCRADGSTWDGIPPFTTPGDFSTPNEAYFAHVDRILRLAADYGFVVILDPVETGGWLSTMVDNGVDKLRAYGQYLGRRYKDFPNIIWMHGNDYQDWGPTYDPYVTAVAQGIRDVDPSHLQTVELNYLVSGSLDDPAWAPLIDLNASYTYEPTYQQVLKDYNRSNFLPTFLVEASYEFEQNPGAPAGTPEQLRRQEYWSLLSGATGQLYGNHYTWQFLCPQRDDAGNCVGGWKDQLDTPGADQMAYVKTLFESRQLVRARSGSGAHGGNERLRDVRGERLRHCCSDAGWDACDGLCTVEPDDHGRPEHAQRPSDGAVVRPHRRDLHEHLGRAVRKRRQHVISRRRGRTQPATTTGCSCWKLTNRRWRRRESNRARCQSSWRSSATRFDSTSRSAVTRARGCCDARTCP